MRIAALAIIVSASFAVQAQQYSPAARGADLDFVQNLLTKADPYFFDQLDPGQFQQAANALRTTISRATDAEFYTGLAHLVALAGDMHTMLYPSSAVDPFPFNFRWLDDGVFVVGASKDYFNTLGTRVVAVEGMPIEQVARQLGTTFAYSNDQFLHVVNENRLRLQPVLQGLHVAPIAPTTAFTFETLAGQQFTLQIAPNRFIDRLDPAVSQGPWPDYLMFGNQYNGTISNSFFYSAANRMLFAKYNTCEDLPGAPVSTFDSGVLAALDANPVDTLVIDFRGNGGGNEYLLFPLGDGLFKRLPALRQNPRFHIYLVIDKGTFSSGMYDPMAFVSGFLSSYDHLPPVNTSGIFTVIGAPTSGKPIGYGNVLPFQLPGSGMNGQYSTVRVNQNLGVIPDTPSFNPDIAIGTRSTDWFARFDPVMAAMLARSNGPPPPPTGNAIVVNGASFRTDHGVAAGSFASVFGAFGQAPDQVLIGGAAAKIVSANTGQVNVVVPAAAVTGTTSVSVRGGGAELASGQFTISAAGPGIFVLNPADPSQPGAIENQDSTVNSACNRAAIGTVVQIFATGYPALDASGNAQAQVYFGDLPGQMLYSGAAPGLPGLWQINAIVPAGTPTGQIPVFITAANLASNGVTMWVQ